MDIFDREAHFTFSNKTEAEAFCGRMRDLARKIEVITVNDILRDRGEPVTSKGFHYGYDRKTVKKWKPEKFGGSWQVILPIPGKLVRDIHGYWTTDAVQTLEELVKNGG